MVNYKDIQKTLNKLNSKYNRNNISNSMAELYSKLAIIEFCGWLEVSLDNIVEDYIDRNINDIDCKKLIKEKINKNHGFAYSNIFDMFCSVIGIVNYERLVTKKIFNEIPILKSITYTYGGLRNRAAHTNTIIGQTKNFNSPSQVIYDYKKLKPVLKDIEAFVNKIQ